MHAHLPVFGYWYAHNAEDLLAFRQALGDENARQLSGIDIALEKMRQGDLASDSTERPNPEDRRIPEPTADRRGPGDSAHVLDFEEQMSGWGAQLCPDFVPTRQELLLLAKHWYDWVDKHNYFLTLNVFPYVDSPSRLLHARIGEIVNVLGEEVLQEEIMYGFNPIVPILVSTDAAVQQHCDRVVTEPPWIEVDLEGMDGDGLFTAVGSTLEEGPVSESLHALHEEYEGSSAIRQSLLYVEYNRRGRQ